MSLIGKLLKVKFNCITEMKLTVGSDAIFLFSHMNSRTAMKQETIIPPVKTMKTPPRFGRPSCALLPPSPPYGNFWEKEKKAGFRENIFFIVYFVKIIVHKKYVKVKTMLLLLKTLD